MYLDFESQILPDQVVPIVDATTTVPYRGVLATPTVNVPAEIATLLYRYLIASASYYDRVQKPIGTPKGFVHHVLSTRSALFERGGEPWAIALSLINKSLAASVRCSTDASDYRVFDLANLMFTGTTLHADGRVAVDYRERIGSTSLATGRIAMMRLVGHALDDHEPVECPACRWARAGEWGSVFGEAKLDGSMVRMLFRQLVRADVYPWDLRPSTVIAPPPGEDEMPF